MNSIRSHAEAIANSPQAAGYGFAPALLIPIAEYVLPILLKCVISRLAEGATEAEQSAEVKRVAESAWNPCEGEYSINVLRQMRPHTHAAMVSQPIESRVIPHGPADVDNASRLILDHARCVEDRDIQQTINEVCPVLATIKVDDKV